MGEEEGRGKKKGLGDKQPPPMMRTGIEVIIEVSPMFVKRKGFWRYCRRGTAGIVQKFCF
jgi:hypothetical protein